MRTVGEKFLSVELPPMKSKLKQVFNNLVFCRNQHKTIRSTQKIYLNYYLGDQFLKNWKLSIIRRDCYIKMDFLLAWYKDASVAAQKRLLGRCFRRASAASSAVCCGGRNRKRRNRLIHLDSSIAACSIAADDAPQ